MFLIGFRTRLRASVNHQHCLYGFGKPEQMLLEWRLERVKPVYAAQKILQRLRRHDLFDANREDWNPFDDGAFDLAPDLIGSISA